MAADGGVDFAVRLINQVTGPAKQVQRSMSDVTKAFKDAQRAMDAPSPKRGAVTDWEKSTAKAKMSQARDFARAQSAVAKLTARDQMKEAKRVADYKFGLAQFKADQYGGMVEDASGAALGIGAGLAATALAAAAAVGYLAVKFGQAAVEAAAFGERSRLALSFLTGSAATGAQQFDSLRREAAGLGLDVERTQGSFQKLLAAQFEVGKARELVRMGADLQAIGAKADDVEGVLLAITQIKSKGKLQAEEMLQLQERGISAELVYSALGEKMGKSKEQLMALQKKGQLGGPEAIDAILAAVRKKTGTEFAGQAGEEFAKTSLAGMLGVWVAKGKNFMIDVGDAILPGVQSLARLLTSGFEKLANDPKIAAIGHFLLREFEIFVLWAEANWPQISTVMLTSLQTLGETMRLVVELFDTSTTSGKVFAGVMMMLGVVLALVTLAGVVLVGGVWLLIGAIGAAIYYVGQLAVFVYEQFKWLYETIKGLFGDDKKPPAGAPAAASPLIATAAESGSSGMLTTMLSGVAEAPATVAAEPQDKLAAGPMFDFSGMQVGANVDTDDLVAKIRAQVTKALEEAA